MHDEFGEPVIDDTYLICLNAHDEPMSWILSPQHGGEFWRVVFDTVSLVDPEAEHASGSEIKVGVRSVVLLATSTGA